MLGDQKTDKKISIKVGGNMEREKKIIKTSILGIVVNIVLVIFKATVGFIVNSIAIILDAVNNLTDALSSIITIIGTKLANKAPDKEHPYGHGRIEYFTSVIIAAIILIARSYSYKRISRKNNKSRRNRLFVSITNNYRSCSCG